MVLEIERAARRAIAPQKPSLDGVHLRDGIPADHDFVRMIILGEMRRLWPYRSKCDERRLSERLARLIPRLLARSQLRIADVNGAMAAFAILDMRESLVHWAHTAVPYRRMGLCRVLLSTLDPGWRYSHDTQHAATAFKELGGTFDPYALIFLQNPEVSDV